MSTIPPKLLLEAELAYARNEQIRCGRELESVIDFVRQAQRLKSGTDRRETEAEFVALNDLAQGIRSHASFRSAQFRRTPSESRVDSVIVSKTEMWKAAAKYVLAIPSGNNPTQTAHKLDLVWQVAQNLGGVADWPILYKAANQQLLSKPSMQVAGTVRKHHGYWWQRSKEIAGELVMLAGYQPIEYNRIIINAFIRDTLTPAFAADKPSSSAEVVRIGDGNKVGELLAEWDEVATATKSLANDWIAEFEHATSNAPTPISREVTMVLRPSPDGDTRKAAVVFVGHEDDFNSKFAATCLKLKEDGFKVVVVVSTDGSGGCPVCQCDVRHPR